jgi:hypothetical protein
MQYFMPEDWVWQIRLRFSAFTVLRVPDASLMNGNIGAGVSAPMALTNLEVVDLTEYRGGHCGLGGAGDALQATQQPEALLPGAFRRGADRADFGRLVVGAGAQVLHCTWLDCVRGG